MSYNFTERATYLMLHHLAEPVATIEVDNLVNYNCHPQEEMAISLVKENVS